MEATGDSQLNAVIEFLVERLEHAHERLGRIEETESANSGYADALRSLNSRVADISDATTRLTRTQFKANSLAETQTRKAEEAISLLRDRIESQEAEARRAAIAAADDVESIRASARAGVVTGLLPTIDGLDLAIENGRRLLVRLENPLPPPDRGGFFARFRTGGSRERAEAAAGTAALEGWLGGLELVRDRFHAFLASEGVTPIDTLGKKFDPRLHVAVAAVDGVGPEGAVAEVLRTGYKTGTAVVRFAEVTVYRSSRSPAPERHSENGEHT